MHCMKVARCLRSVVKPTHCPRTSFSLTIEERPNGEEASMVRKCFSWLSCMLAIQGLLLGKGGGFVSWASGSGERRAAELQDEKDTVQGRPLLSVQQGCSFCLFLTLGCLQQRHQKSRFLSHSHAYPIAVGV